MHYQTGAWEQVKATSKSERAGVIGEGIRVDSGRSCGFQHRDLATMTAPAIRQTQTKIKAIIRIDTRPVEVGGMESPGIV